MIQVAEFSGSAWGQLFLGECYRYGIGVRKDLAEAVRYYRLSAAQGNVQGQYVLAGCYYTGEGVLQNFSEACRYFQLSADQGNVSGLYGLGLCYQSATWAEKDLTKAFDYHRRAAELGDCLAQGAVGLCYSRLFTGGERAQRREGAVTRCGGSEIATRLVTESQRTRLRLCVGTGRVRQ